MNTAYEYRKQTPFMLNRWVRESSEIPLRFKELYRSFVQGCITLTLLLLIVFGGTSSSAAANSMTGLWWVSGSDDALGPYHGLLEIRPQTDGTLQAIRLVSLDEYRYHDGRHVDLVWTGSVETDTTQSARILVALRRADFITQVGELERTPDDGKPLEVIGQIQRRGDKLDILYTAENFSATEKARRLGPAGNKPIWQSERFEHATHPDPAICFELNPYLQLLLTSDRALEALYEMLLETDCPSDPTNLNPQVIFIGPLFNLLASSKPSYYDLPGVQPFVKDPLFQDAIHFQVVDHTDFNYYRLYRNRLRVVNKVVDAISLAETEIRANAFRASVNEKERFYQEGLTYKEGLPLEFVGPHGMVVQSLMVDATGTEQENPEGSSALWTGIYTYTQALRYKHTRQPKEKDEALANLRHSLQAILTLMDITGDPKTFARTLRVHISDPKEPWYWGGDRFPDLDWLEGGNNDMAKGLVLAMIAGWEVLPKDDPLREAISVHALRLLQLDIFDPTNKENITSGNPALALLLAGITNDSCVMPQSPNLTCVEAGLTWLHDKFQMLSAQYGSGPFYLFGISDWSGNHLALTRILALQWLLARTGDGVLQELWAQAPARVWESLRLLEQPLFATLAAPAYPPHSTKRQQAIEQVTWGLRSFPLPKHPYTVDHRLRDDFVLSPFPSLLWKLDWTVNPQRQQSIRAYPMLEQTMDAYFWNDGPFPTGPSGLGKRRVSGVDYLFLYWIARDKGLVSPFVK